MNDFEICILKEDMEKYLSGEKVSFRFASSPKDEEVKVRVDENKLNFLLGRTEGKILLKG